MVGQVSLYNEAAAKINDLCSASELLDGHTQNLLHRLKAASTTQVVAQCENVSAAQSQAGACIGPVNTSAIFGAPLHGINDTALKYPLPRQSLLREAYDITSSDRNSAYGNPEDNFANIAAYWNNYCQQRFKVALDITPQDVAHFMILMKMARLATNTSHRDSLVDIAGYAACAEDCRSSKLPKAHSA